jgi:hypothetical protein
LAFEFWPLSLYFVFFVFAAKRPKFFLGQNTICVLKEVTNRRRASSGNMTPRSGGEIFRPGTHENRQAVLSPVSQSTGLDHRLAARHTGGLLIWLATPNR